MIQLTRLSPYLGVTFDKTDENYLIYIDAPGADRKSLKATIEDDTLNIGWVRGSSGVDYLKQVRLPQNTIDAGKVSAKYEDGVITITLPVLATAQPVKIKIQ